MNEETIFHLAREKPPTERAAFLEVACGGDQALRRRLESILLAHDNPSSFLARPAIDLGSATDVPPLADVHGNGSDPFGPMAPDARPVSEGPGTVVGPYKLLEVIGEGGFGVVFMAEQQRPVRRKVALKVLKPGMDTRQVVARFEAERQALAVMDHPHIARIFDGGETDSGRPYFVMELVRGIPITEFCDQGRLTLRERLELFVSVCQAVQHAHQKGIIHRDLKPANVLVTLHDGTPVAKVIDFGIAKALGQQLTEKTLFTNFAQLIGTPLYMSPEQAALSGLDVDTRTDIYALGVLLYELLTGSTPFDQERLKTAAFDEVRRIIREEEPPKPSTRMSTLGPSATTVSANRRSDPKRLRQLLRGELDWIVMKCLEKDRNRRYETVDGLRLDVQRYLADEPVQACPPSVWYRFSKFARRHRAALAMAGIILSILVLLGGGAGWVVRDRAARLAMTEREVNRALGEAITLQGQSKWPEALEAAKRADGFLAVGASESLRRRVRELRKDLEMVLRLEEIWLPRPVEGPAGDYGNNTWADAAYAEAFREYGIDLEALEPSESAERIRARTVRLELATALDSWADKRKKQYKTGETSWKRLVIVARSADPDEWRNQLRDALEQHDLATLTKLAASARISDLPAQALSLLASALETEHLQSLLRRAQREHPDNFWFNFQLAWELDHAPSADQNASVDEAIRFYTVALALRPRNVPTHGFLARALRRRGRLDEAIALYRRATELDPHDTGLHFFIGDCLKDQGKLREAILEFRPHIAGWRKDMVINASDVDTHTSLGDVLQSQGKLNEAITEYSKAVELAQWRRAVALNPDDETAHAQLACVLQMHEGNPGEAIDEYRRAIELRPGASLHVYNNLAWILATCPDTRCRDPRQAIVFAQKAVDQNPNPETWNTLGVACYRSGRWKEAIEALSRSMDLLRGQNESFNTFFLAMAHWQLGHKDDARSWYDRAMQWMAKHAPNNDDLRRFRAEAAALLGLPEPAAPAEKEVRRPSKR